jgi:hypothetical protein
MKWKPGFKVCLQMQRAPLQLGDSATFTAGGLKVEHLMAPPSKEEMHAAVAPPNKA